MEVSEKIVYCADAIVHYGNMKRIVLVERLGGVNGLALPGGKQNTGENLSETIRREVREETGLHFVPEEVLGIYADPMRDPRGRYISCVFIGMAHGVMRDEPGKTRVVMKDLRDLESFKADLMFDHARILSEYVAHNS